MKKPDEKLERLLDFIDTWLHIEFPQTDADIPELEAKIRWVPMVMSRASTGGLVAAPEDAQIADLHAGYTVPSHLKASTDSIHGFRQAEETHFMITFPGFSGKEAADRIKGWLEADFGFDNLEIISRQNKSGDLLTRQVQETADLDSAVVLSIPVQGNGRSLVRALTVKDEMDIQIGVKENYPLLATYTIAYINTQNERPSTFDTSVHEVGIQ